MPKMVIFLVQFDEWVSSNHRENKNGFRQNAQKGGLIPPFLELSNDKVGENPCQIEVLKVFRMDI